MLRRALLALILAGAVWPGQAAARIVVVDRAGRVVASPVRAGETPLRLVRWTDDGSGLYVAVPQPRTREKAARYVYSRVALDTGARAALPTLAGSWGLGPGLRSFAIDAAPGTFTIKAGDGHAVATVAIAAGGLQATWSPSGRRVAVSSGAELVIVDADSGMVLLRRRAGRDFGLALSAQAFSPDEQQIVYRSGDSVLVADLATGLDRVLLNSARGLHGERPEAQWPATGRIAVMAGPVVSFPGEPAIASLRPPDDAFDIVFDPTGTTLVYGFLVGGRHCAATLGGIAAEPVPGPGRPVVLLAPTDAEVEASRWSPDGQRLAIDMGPSYLAIDARRGRRHPWPKRPIPHDFAVIERGGNARVRAAIVRFSRRLRAGAGRETALQALRWDLHDVDELADTIVGEAIASEVDVWLRAAGFRGIDALDELEC